MIKVKNGMVSIEGKPEDILADLTLSIKGVKTVLEENLGEDITRKTIFCAYQIAMEKDEEK